MKRSLLVGTFAVCSVGTVSVGALDSVPSMYGSDSMKSITQL